MISKAENLRIMSELFPKDSNELPTKEQLPNLGDHLTEADLRRILNNSLEQGKTCYAKGEGHNGIEYLLIATAAYRAIEKMYTDKDLPQ